MKVKRERKQNAATVLCTQAISTPAGELCFTRDAVPPTASKILPVSLTGVPNFHSRDRRTLKT